MATKQITEAQIHTATNKLERLTRATDSARERDRVAESKLSDAKYAYKKIHDSALAKMKEEYLYRDELIRKGIYRYVYPEYGYKDEREVKAMLNLLLNDRK